MYMYDETNWGDYSPENSEEYESESDSNFVSRKKEEVQGAHVASNKSFQNPCDKRWERNVGRLQEEVSQNSQNSEYGKKSKMWERSSKFNRVNTENRARETGKLPLTIEKACTKKESVKSRIVSKRDTSVPWARIV